MDNKKIKMRVALLLSLLTVFSSVLSPVSIAETPILGVSVQAATGNNKDASDGGSKALEDIMKGLSSFTFEGYEWPNTLTVGGSAFSIANTLFTKRHSDTKKSSLWKENAEVCAGALNFYSSTDWTKFSGMFESVEIENSCRAELTKEVEAYEDLMDAAADKYGFTQYKEIFKAIAQARFNENKKVYAEAKKLKYIKGTGEDKFDLFHIDGSWVDGAKGSKTPVGADKAPTPTPTSPPRQQIVNPNGEVVVATPTPLPKNTEGNQYEAAAKKSMTVADSIEYAAIAFNDVLTRAAYPSPYNTDKLISIVQGFEFGGNSKKIRNRYTKVGKQFPGASNFITFTEYCDSQSLADSSQMQSEAQENVDYDKIIAQYAKIVANGEKRSSSSKYGKYKCSDQKFYQKVFEHYKCTGGGSIDFGELPADMKEILRKCMSTWGSKVTKERREIIQQAVLLYGVTYSMDLKNRPSYEHPSYLDCSSFVGQCYWRSGVAKEGKAAADWWTGPISHVFSEINESQLIPGDVGQIHWPGTEGGSDHVGIYIGSIDGTKYWIHCTGSGNGVKINSYGGFKHYGRYPGLK